MYHDRRIHAKTRPKYSARNVTTTHIQHHRCNLLGSPTIDDYCYGVYGKTNHDISGYTRSLVYLMGAESAKTSETRMNPNRIERDPYNVWNDFS